MVTQDFYAAPKYHLVLKFRFRLTRGALDRAINLVQEESYILLDLARLHYDQKNYEEAKFLGGKNVGKFERYNLRTAETQSALRILKDFSAFSASLRLIFLRISVVKYARLSPWKLFPPRSIHLQLNSNKTLNITALSRTN